jgi:formyl-CoA transferase
MENSSNKGPLAGLKVVELGQLIAGPFAAKTLADFGADVVKIEPPGAGDPLRNWRLLKNGTSVWWQVQSRNKRSVALDLRQPEAQEIVRKLAAEADVMVENFRPGALEGWGLDPQQLIEANPRLVVLRISGYGQTGPYRDRPGFGVVGEAMGGLRHLTAEPGRVPVRVGVSIGDTLAALHGVIGILMALHERERSGRGQVIDVALYEAVFNCMESLLPEYSAFGAVRGPGGSALPGIAPTNAYLCKDGGYALVAGNGDSIFKRLMLAIGREDLASDPGLAVNAGRVARGDRRMDAHAHRGRGAGRARWRRRALGAHLHGGRHRGRSALRRPRHAAAGAAGRGRHADGAGHRAQAVAHAGRPAAQRARTRAGHRCRDARAGADRRTDRGAEEPRRDRRLNPAGLRAGRSGRRLPARRSSGRRARSAPCGH